jgi:alanine dehydrogenase
MTDTFRYLTEADVAALISLPQTITALEETLAHQAEGSATTVPKAMAQWKGGSLHALASVDEAASVAGIKSWINTPSGAVAVMLLFDASRGVLLGVIEAGVLGALRTAGVSAIATARLAAANTQTAAIIGSGRQAFLQLAAILAARNVKNVKVWSPTPEKRAQFAMRASALFGQTIEDAPSLAAACEGAEIIATVTRACEPFLSLDHVQQGAHVNAIGAILKGTRELAPEIMASADIIAVDDISTSRAGSQELIDWEAEPHLADRLVSLSALTADHRPAAPRLTLFKSMGMGLSDLAVAGAAIRAAELQGLGESRPHPSPVIPRWRN